MFSSPTEQPASPSSATTEASETKNDETTDHPWQWIAPEGVTTSFREWLLAQVKPEGARDTDSWITPKWRNAHPSPISVTFKTPSQTQQTFHLSALGDGSNNCIFDLKPAPEETVLETFPAVVLVFPKTIHPTIGTSTQRAILALTEMREFYGKIDAYSYIATKHSGHDLGEYAKKHTTPDAWKSFFHATCDAVCQLHQKELIHGDIKPGNFLFDPETKRAAAIDLEFSTFLKRCVIAMIISAQSSTCPAPTDYDAAAAIAKSLGLNCHDLLNLVGKSSSDTLSIELFTTTFADPSLETQHPPAITLLGNRAVKLDPFRGTPGFAAPELMMNIAFKESDIFALACLWIELLEPTEKPRVIPATPLFMPSEDVCNAAAQSLFGKDFCFLPHFRQKQLLTQISNAQSAAAPAPEHSTSTSQEGLDILHLSEWLRRFIKTSNESVPGQSYKKITHDYTVIAQLHRLIEEKLGSEAKHFTLLLIDMLQQNPTKRPNSEQVKERLQACFPQPALAPHPPREETYGTPEPSSPAIAPQTPAMAELPEALHAYSSGSTGVGAAAGAAQVTTGAYAETQSIRKLAFSATPARTTIAISP